MYVCFKARGVVSRACVGFSRLYLEVVLIFVTAFFRQQVDLVVESIPFLVSGRSCACFLHAQM